MSRILCAVLGGAFLIAAPMAAAQPDLVAKPADATPAAAETAAVAADRTIRAESLDGLIVNTIYLDGDGSLRIIAEEDGATTRGHWFARNDMVCLDWQPRGRECWPYQNLAARRADNHHQRSRPASPGDVAQLRAADA